MTTMTVTPPVAPTPPIEEVKPGFLTSEFWSMTLVHLLAAAATMFTLLNVHWSKGLSAVQAAVPLVSIAISAILQAAYHNKRAAVKIDRTAKVADAFVASVEAGYSRYAPAVTTTLSGISGTYTPMVSTFNPDLAAKMTKATDVAETVLSDAEQVVDAWHADMRDVPGPSPAVDAVAEPVETDEVPSSEPPGAS